MTHLQLSGKIVISALALFCLQWVAPAYAQDVAQPYRKAVEECLKDSACRNAMMVLPAMRSCMTDSDCSIASWRVCGCPMQEAVNQTYIPVFPQGETQTACRSSCDPHTPYPAVTAAHCTQGMCIPNKRR